MAQAGYGGTDGSPGGPAPAGQWRSLTPADHKDPAVTAASAEASSPGEVPAEQPGDKAGIRNPTIDGVAVPRSADVAAAGGAAPDPHIVAARAAADAAATRIADSPTTRRRSVVFEEDDELDVPDFLK